MGVGLEEENVLGPLQNKQQYDIVAKLVQAAKDSGARVLTGGDPDAAQPGYFYPTTLVADIDNDNPLVAEEQFGPALPIIKYTDLEQAIRTGPTSSKSDWAPRSGAATSSSARRSLLDCKQERRGSTSTVP